VADNHGATLTSAIRSLLYVPGNRPERIAKALASAADCVIVDLEDSVSVAHKVGARGVAAAAIDACAVRPGGRLAVRVNALHSGLLQGDVDVLNGVWSRLDFVIHPMTADASTVHEVVRHLAAADERADSESEGPLLIPLVETAAGVLSAREIAAADARVFTLALGPADLAHELGLTPTARGDELRQARAMLVLAAAAAGRERPIDGPWLDLADASGLRESVSEARRLGFSGKQVIHPSQLQLVHDGLAPTSGEVAWARRVVSAFETAESAGIASIRLDDGSFVDYPVARRAAAILERVTDASSA
jgi:citrate lyase subunit beta/citryl-CoA lyase